MYEAEDSTNTWFNKDRSESASFRMPNKTFNNINVINPALGLNIYENAILEEKCNSYINLLESKLNGQTRYKWNEATVTNSVKPIKSARNCSDFKYKHTDLGPSNDENAELITMHQEIYNILKPCVDDYANYWGINGVITGTLIGYAVAWVPYFRLEQKLFGSGITIWFKEILQPVLIPIALQLITITTLRNLLTPPRNFFVVVSYCSISISVAWIVFYLFFMKDIDKKSIFSSIKKAE
jgi:hypothetical protein